MKFSSRLMKDLIAIIGTTGVGKSQLGVELAKSLNGEVINGDSMQMYRGLDVITNKHSIKDQEGIPHHLLGHVDWVEEYTVQRFVKEATRVIDDIHSRGKLPILVGGTHYYNQAILMRNSTMTDHSISNESSSEEEDSSDTYTGATDASHTVDTTTSISSLTQHQLQILNGPPDLGLEYLKKVDPLVAEKFHPNDTRRIHRALEIYFQTSKRPSDLYLQQEGDNVNTSESTSLRYRTLVLWVWSDLKVLGSRLDQRVDNMLENGLYDEINQLYTEYKSTSPPPDFERGVWQVIGFKEFIPWLNKQIDDPSECVKVMKQKTRKYARQQTKFMKVKIINTLSQLKCKQPLLCGDVGLLDATDLSIWSSQVQQRGLALANDFVNKRPLSIPLAPSGLEYLLESKESFGRDQWQHFECPVCKQSYGSSAPYIAVGEKQWKIHLQSRKHKSSLRTERKKLEYETWKSKNKPELSG